MKAGEAAQTASRPLRGYQRRPDPTPPRPSPWRGTSAVALYSPNQKRSLLPALAGLGRAGWSVQGARLQTFSLQPPLPVPSPLVPDPDLRDRRDIASRTANTNP